jgi:tetratricopeptide (TPR) repeat protein
LKLTRGAGAAAFAGAALLLLVSSVQLIWAADSPAAADGARKINAGDYRGAISTLQSAVTQNPSDDAAFYWLGRAYYEIRDYDNSASAEEKAVALAPKNALYHEWLGRAYGGKADRERSFFVAKKVKAEFESAVHLDPSNIDARRDLEEYCIDAPWIAGGNKDEAQAQVDAIAALDPVEGHVARAVFDNEALKKPAQADAEFHMVLGAKSERIAPYLDAANFFITQNKGADVTAAIATATAVVPNDPRLGYYRGVAAVLSGGDTTSAERYLKSYIASTPDRSDWPSHAAAREWLGRLYEAQGNTAAAAEQYRASLQLDPSRKDARDRLNKLGKESQ